MKKNELLKKMENQVNRVVKHYKSDFDYDLEHFNKNDFGTYVWYVRNSGTQLAKIAGPDMTEKDIEKSFDYINAVESVFNNYKKYMIVFNGDNNNIKLLANTL